MVADELISLAGTAAVLLIAVGVVIALVRARRPGANVRDRRAGRVAQIGVVVGLLVVAAVLLVFGALAPTDSRFRF